MNLPSEIAVMSLPNAILFPQAVLPLHIFEPRYRAMLRDALDSHRLFSVALMREPPQPGQPEPEPHDVACVGLIRAAIALDDGTSNVLLQGVHRVRLVHFVEGKPYRLAAIEDLPSSHTGEVGPGALAAKVTELVKARHSAGQSMPETLLKSLVKIRDADTLTDLAAFVMLSDFSQKQQMLETQDLRLRQRKLLRLFQCEIDQLKAGRQAPGNEPQKGFGSN